MCAIFISKDWCRQQLVPKLAYILAVCIVASRLRWNGRWPKSRRSGTREMRVSRKMYRCYRPPARDITLSQQAWQAPVLRLATCVIDRRVLDRRCNEKEKPTRSNFCRSVLPADCKFFPRFLYTYSRETITIRGYLKKEKKRKKKRIHDREARPRQHSGAPQIFSTLL